MTRLKQVYKDLVVPALKEEFNYSNPMQVPKLEKIVINMGVGEAAQDKKKIEGPLSDMAAISGQKPVKTSSTKSIAGFKLREDMVIGCKVTLRKDRCTNFSTVL